MNNHKKRASCQQRNHPKYIGILIYYFHVNQNEIFLEEGKIKVTFFNKRGLKIGIIETLKLLYLGEEISFCFDDVIKHDYKIKEFTIEAKEKSSLFCESLSITKNSEYKKQWEDWCANIGVDPILANNIALENFANKYGDEYLNGAMERMSDHFLIDDIVLTKQEFLQQYRLVVNINYSPYYRFQILIKKIKNGEEPKVYKKEKIPVFENSEQIDKPTHIHISIKDVKFIQIYKRKIDEWKENQKRLNKSNFKPGQGTRSRIQREALEECNINN